MKNNNIIEVEEVFLSDGTKILMEINTENYEGPVSIQQLKISAKQTFSVVSTLAKDIKDCVEKARPDKAVVEFSIELEKKSGDVMAKIVNFNGKGSIKFSLEWNFNNIDK